MLVPSLSKLYSGTLGPAERRSERLGERQRITGAQLCTNDSRRKLRRALYASTARLELLMSADGQLESSEDKRIAETAALGSARVFSGGGATFAASLGIMKERVC